MHIRTDIEFSQLVQFGITPENKALEFKGTYQMNNPRQTRELRKDIVSLANTQGGVLLVGITERGNAGYKVADDCLQNDIEGMKQWISHTLSSYVFPTVTYSLDIIKTANRAGNDFEIVAVNVDPYINGIGCFRHDNNFDVFAFPYRDDYGVKLLNAAEVFQMAGGQTRRIELVMSHLCRPIGQRIKVMSRVVFRRLERDGERTERLRRFHSSETWNPTNPPDWARSQVVESAASHLTITACEFDDQQLQLLVNNLPLNIPIGIIRELWRIDPNHLGIMLDCAIAYSDIDGESVSLQTL